MARTQKAIALGVRLRSAREALGMTQEELAQAAGTSQDVVQKIENGNVERPRRLEALAAAVKRSPAWLQFGVEAIDTLTPEAIRAAQAIDALPPDKRKAYLDLLGVADKA